MCRSSPPRDNSAEIARQQEAQRQANIAQGRTSIDSQFNQFNDQFFDNYTNDYTNYYFPQLDDQYGDARRRLTLQLAQTGNLTGSAGANQLNDLTEFYNQQRQSIQNQALGATRDLRSQVDNSRSQLYANNQAAADPGSASAAAISAAQSLQPTAPSDPLANVFTDFFNNIGNNAAIANQNQRLSGEASGVQTFGGGSGSSVRVFGQ